MSKKNADDLVAPVVLVEDIAAFSEPTPAERAWELYSKAIPILLAANGRLTKTMCETVAESCVTAVDAFLEEPKPF